MRSATYAPWPVDSLPPIFIEKLLDDPDALRGLIERYSPYFPVQRYFSIDAEYRASSGQGDAHDRRTELSGRLGVREAAGRGPLPEARLRNYRPLPVLPILWRFLHRTGAGLGFGMDSPWLGAETAARVDVLTRKWEVLRVSPCY